MRALPVAYRIEAGLRDVPPPPGPRGALARQVAAEWSQLAELLRQTAKAPPAQRPAPRALMNLQRTIASQAQALGMDACAPPMS
jgi:hypothetical protein